MTGREGWIRRASLTVSTDKYEKALRDFVEELSDWSGDISDEEVESQITATTLKNRNMAEKFTALLAIAISKTPNWQGSPVRVSLSVPDFRSADDPFEALDVYDVRVGREATFSAWVEGSSIRVEDVLEAGDSDFFYDEDTTSDYFALILKLRDPVSAGGKILRLWTARPSRDRSQYENARRLPSNIFLTNDPDRALGMARDMGDRDVWEVRVDSSYLVETLSRGRIRDYQVIGSAPLKDIFLLPSIKTAATIPEILGGTDPSILGKTSGVSLKQRLFNPDRGFWMFTATGSKGEQYTVRIKASPKGTGKKVGALPVRVSCSCPFFRWQGPEHWASQENYLWGKPVGTASKPVVKDPSSTHRVCKHVAAALEAAKKYRISTVSKWSLSGPIHPETLDSRTERFLENHLDLKRFGRRIGFREKENGTGEARQHGNEIWLFPKFWELSEEEQDFVLAHEIGHWVLFNFGLLEFGRLASKLGIDVWDTSSLPFAQYNQEEAFADCFASFYLDGSVEKRYPAWSTLVREISGSVG